MKDEIIKMLNSNNYDDVILGLKIMMKENLLEEIFVDDPGYCHDTYSSFFQRKKSGRRNIDYVIFDDGIFHIEDKWIAIMKKDCEEEVFTYHYNIIYNERENNTAITEH